MNPQLAEIADEINALPNLIQASEICELRHNEVAFRLNFDYALGENGNAFCTIKEKIMQTMNAKPESKATPKKGKETRANNLQDKASHILIATRFSTTSSRLMAVYSEQPALGSAFNPVGNVDKNTAKVFAAFLNSSFGIIQMLNRRTKKLTYPAYEASQLKTLRLPDPQTDLSPLLEAFEKVKNTPLKKLADCDTDPARRILDHAAAKVIGKNPAITDQWRTYLACEPTINNRQWKT